MKTETIHPVKALSGPLELPGDKSISHRYAMIAALADGSSELRHFAAAADCHSTLACMKALGAEVKIDKDTVRVTGHGLRGRLLRRHAMSRQCRQQNRENQKGAKKHSRFRCYLKRSAAC